jgi:hypothetical protein
MKSYLGRRQPQQPASKEELESMRKKAWHEQGLILIRPGEILDDWLRQGVINLANRLFGKRRV